jgi:hypothetical protein
MDALVCNPNDRPLNDLTPQRQKGVRREGTWQTRGRAVGERTWVPFLKVCSFPTPYMQLS